MRLTRPASLSVEDANATSADVINPKTFYAGDAEKKVGSITAASDLSHVDADLVQANIKNGITIFGVTGSVDVRDVSDADAQVGEVKEGKTFYAVGGARKTGTLPTKTLNPSSETVEAGWYAATTLSAVDADLVAANIKSGITIFGKTGPNTVQDIADADAVVDDVVLGKTFYSAAGAKKTGTLDAPGALTEGDSDHGWNTVTTLGDGNSSFDGYRHYKVIGAETEVQLATKTIDFTDDPCLVVGMAFAYAYGDEDVTKLRLYMDNVQMAESDIVASGSLINLIVLMASKTMTGSKAIKLKAYNYDAIDDDTLYTYSDCDGNQKVPYVVAAMGVTH
jgi:hypothetical protein